MDAGLSFQPYRCQCKIDISSIIDLLILWWNVQIMDKFFVQRIRDARYISDLIMVAKSVQIPSGITKIFGGLVVEIGMMQ